MTWIKNQGVNVTAAIGVGSKVEKPKAELCDLQDSSWRLQSHTPLLQHQPEGT